MALVDQLLGQVADDPLGPSVSGRRDALYQRCDLCDSHREHPSVQVLHEGHRTRCASAARESQTATARKNRTPRIGALDPRARVRGVGRGAGVGGVTASARRRTGDDEEPGLGGAALERRHVTVHGPPRRAVGITLVSNMPVRVGDHRLGPTVPVDRVGDLDVGIGRESEPSIRTSSRSRPRRRATANGGLEGSTGRRRGPASRAPASAEGRDCHAPRSPASVPCHIGTSRISLPRRRPGDAEARR